MAKEIKIQVFDLSNGEEIKVAESVLAELVNEGWTIVAMSGDDTTSFVILQRDDNHDCE